MVVARPPATHYVIADASPSNAEILKKRCQEWLETVVNARGILDTCATSKQNLTKKAKSKTDR
ncbi:hypothetical protein Ptr902_07228 [Pyrenophora tritici-repentis]|uniref:Uncharacterized protein n=1 Tax=Pyrenophora tritici-repentis TaxID=45151 RepID=A0A5M9KNB2_9PLEO|nr:hypothetical protein PtrV1_12945 [Pyrenophora tritici-repentis]KAF7569392.1 hypothetical protein PtrM4_118070 [Pyrenophora tritici-repentis]KAI0568906.1 hypothetical protein Alg215_11935 [Pyrenophora tritici-repentis]KAI0570404.1 hypothetical protein Alg130_11246 [Pyrenophora tritici-repentis]KAI0604557.1 hypothetical protein TUN205_11196 [Pyrenophora tritici-repentis]